MFTDKSAWRSPYRRLLILCKHDDDDNNNNNNNNNNNTNNNKARDRSSTLNYATTATFHIISNSLFTSILFHAM
jgi:hypothetical protein